MLEYLSQVAETHGISSVRRSLDVDRVTVTFNKSVIGAYCSALADVCKQVAGPSLDDSAYVPSELDIGLYCNLLLQSRISHCLGKRLPMAPNAAKFWMIPAGLNAVLACIGECEDRELAVQIVLSQDDSDYESISNLKTNEVYQRVRAFLLEFEGNIVCSHTLPKDRSGDFEFMCFRVVTQEVNKEKKSLLGHFKKAPDPGKALASSFLTMISLSTVLESRFHFGEVGDYTWPVRELARIKGSRSA